MKRSLLCISLLLLVFIGTSLVISAASGGEQLVEDIVLTVGASESERGVAWFSDVGTSGEVRLAKASEVVDGVFPSEYASFSVSATSVVNLEGKYRKHATLTGLCESTSYAYVITADGETSKIYYFDTGSFGDYEFVFVGDCGKAFKNSCVSHGGWE